MGTPTGLPWWARGRRLEDERAVLPRACSRFTAVIPKVVGRLDDLIPGLVETQLAGLEHHLDANGAVIECWRCNPDPAETRRFDPGAYEVDFTPLPSDISGRSRSAFIDGHFIGSRSGQIGLADRSGDLSSVFVHTADAFGDEANIPFVLIIYRG